MTDCPLWQRQPRERLQTYLYKKIYIQELKKATKKLEDVIVFIQDLPSEISDDVCLYLYNDNLIELPTLTQLTDYSKRYCWSQADEAYSNHLTELDHKRREQNYHESVDDMDDLIDTMFEITKDAADELKDSEYKTSTKIQLGYTLSRTIDLLNKNKRLNHGRPTTISKADVEMEAEVNYGNFENLIEAFDASKREWDKRKP
jgi:hypothetical protein